MTISREQLLYGCLAIGFAYIYIPLFTWLRLRHYYPNGGMPGVKGALIKYGGIFLVGMASMTGTAYVLLHPALQMLTVPISILYGAGAVGMVLLIGALMNLPRLQKATATLDSQPAVVRDSLREAEQAMSGHPSLRMRIRVWLLTLVFLVLFGAVYWYENTVNAPPRDARSATVTGN